MMAWVVLLWLVRITVDDLRYRRIPIRLLWPGIAAVAAMSIVHPVMGAAAVLAAVPYLCAALCRFCGGGDVKFAFVLGGLIAAPMAALMMVVLANVLGLAAHAAFRRRGPLPHAPALVTATVCLLAVS